MGRDERHHNQAPERGAGLPPAGDAQRDELKRRADVLEEKAEAANAEVQGAVGDVPLAQIPVENEIAQHFTRADDSFMLKVSEAQADRAYKWVCDRLPSGQSSLQVERAMVDGWTVVQGSDPECREKLDPRGYRKVGDSILMWMTKARYDQLQVRDAVERAEMHGDALGPNERLAELCDRYPGIAVMHADPNDPVVQRAFKRGAAMSTATDQFVRKIREGAPMGGFRPGGEIQAAR